MAENKKINVVVNMLVPEPVGYDGKSGGEDRLLEMLKYWEKDDDVRIIIITTKKREEYFKQRYIFANFKIIKTKLKFSNLFELCLGALFLIVKSFFSVDRGFLKDKDVKTIFYASSDLFWEVVPAFLHKVGSKKIKWVQVIHHIYPDWKKRPGSKINSFFGYYLQRFSLFLIRKKADKIILVNNLIKQELLRRGFAEKKIEVLSNGIEFDYFDKVVKSNVVYEGVFLGRLSASKGVADLIPIWNKVCEEIPGAKLAIIGGAEQNEKTKFIQEIIKSGLEKNIEVLGYLEDKEAFGILKASKIFISPSHEEGWGISITEAMACGLPVISWNLLVYKEIFENYTVQIVENNIDQFAEKIIELLENDIKRKEIGNAGKEFIKKYSWKDVAEKELKIIRA